MASSNIVFDSDTPQVVQNAIQKDIFDDATLPTIVCCMCGESITPNPTSMCILCLKAQVNVTQSISTQNQLQWCRFCDRYLQPPNSWLNVSIESRELLAHCLKKIKGYGGRDQPRLVDAGFTWTEPHSRRIKVWLTLQADVMGSILQQKCHVEFIVMHLICSDCHRAETNTSWRATVQLRQRAVHKKTLLYLEQLMVKLQPHKRVSKIKTSPDGLDFFFLQQDQARKLVDFFLEVVPCRYKLSKELVSHDTHNNTYDYKFAYAVEVVPICKDDVVYIPKSLARSLGNISQGPLICTKVAQVIHLIDPLSLQTCEISSNQYWRQPFPVLSNPKNLLQFLVLENEVDLKFQKGLVRNSRGSGTPINNTLSDLWLLRMQEGSLIGSEQDQQIHSRTHLGHILKPGDCAIGFCIKTSNLNLSSDLQKDFDRDITRLPDVIILKKYYGDSVTRSKNRKWELKRLGEMETDREDGLEEFMEELEEDKEMRKQVNIYKKPYAKRHRRKAPVGMDINDVMTSDSDVMDTVDSPSGEDQAPTIALEEMLDDLCLESVNTDEN
ncbi:60S ribosomal export protein NMD3 [Oopsacas minuta]|uniref:60S ribosomal export protein NMD3 n=1 Tax=Oopsacas minuta TaxID=111878 RepID=A0AAV7KDM8_9METZ|nr:60S ribosomal export protein NMD3 [Oopsacas minuta]